jgi:hypothetical protein
MPCDSSTFSGESVEYQLSKAMWKPSRYWARPAAMLGHEFLRRHAFLLGGDHDRGAVGVVGADEVHLRCCPPSFCIRWKRTQMSAWMYSIMWPMWKAALA